MRMKKQMSMGRCVLGAVLCLVLLLCGCGQEGKPADEYAGGTESIRETGTESGVESEVPEGDSEREAGNVTDPETAGEDGEQGSAAGTDDLAAVQEEMALKDACADYFTLGVGINGSTLENLTTYNPEYMGLVKEHFNSVTLTNLMKCSYILQQRASQESEDGSPVLDYASIDDTLQWCMDNGVRMRGHTLVWHTQAPGWFFREGYQSDGALVDKETMLFRMESYIQQLLGHVQENYPGVVYCWDVVNEAVDPGAGDPDSFFSCRMKNDGNANLWYDTIGPEYVEYAFTYARKYADEDVKLFYNDFNTYETKKCDYIYLLCEDLKEKGLIDGIGMQGYWGMDYPDMHTIIQAITKYARLDLEIQITELSVGVEEETAEAFEEQAKRYRNIFFQLKSLDTAGGGNANITNVTFFGLMDHYVEGDKTNARLFDRYYQPKEAFYAVRDIFMRYYQ